MEESDDVKEEIGRFRAELGEVVAGERREIRHGLAVAAADAFGEHVG